MKKIKFLTLVSCAALGAVVMSGCVKDESDGVKAIREAEANRINAVAEGLRIDNSYEQAVQQYKIKEAEFAMLEKKMMYELAAAGHAEDVELALLGAKADLEAAKNDVAIAKMEASVKLLDAYADKGLTATEKFDYDLIKDQVDAIKTELDAFYDASNPTGNGYALLLGKINTQITKLYGSDGKSGLHGNVAAQNALIKTYTDALPANAADAEKTAELNRQITAANLKIANINLEITKETATLNELKADYATYDNFKTRKNAEIAALQAQLDALIAIAKTRV